jgi:hypothetical protein
MDDDIYVMSHGMDKVFAWDDPQGATYGIRALGFRSASPNKEADELGLNKDGRSCRGVPYWCRPVDNSKRRGMKSLPKRGRRSSIRYT